MPSDLQRVDLLLKFSLLAAGQEDDFFDRQLGPIHLIKYVYLADLAFSKRRQGETFTGVEWQFYKFGPWSLEVNDRIEPALKSINAESKVFESNYEGKEDWIRWNLQNEELFNQLTAQLPVIIAPRLKQLIHKFGKDTPALLEYVYNTPPMLNAAPNELLNFSFIVTEPEDGEENIESFQPLQLSKGKQKKLAERISALRSKNFSSDLKKLADPVSVTQDDEVLQSGLEWLDKLSGSPIEEGKFTANFDELVWKSKTRTEGDIS